MKLKKKRSERKWNESQSSQPTPMHNPMHNQSQMKTPYIINWKSFPLHNQLQNFLSYLPIVCWGCGVVIIHHPTLREKVPIGPSAQLQGKRWSPLECHDITMEYLWQRGTSLKWPWPGAPAGSWAKARREDQPHLVALGKPWWVKWRAGRNFKIYATDIGCNLSLLEC